MTDISATDFFRQATGETHTAALATTAAVQDGDDIPSRFLNPHGHHIRANVGGYTNVEMVPRHEVERYASQETSPEHAKAVGAHLATSGQMEPLMLHYHPATGEAYLGEGNHRLRAARALGMDHVPLRVQRSHSGLPGPGVKVPQDHPALAAGTHIPADIHPSHIGFTTVDKPSIPQHELDTARAEYRLTGRPRMAAATKPCPCCQGFGEHGTGFECYHCDAGMTVPADSPDDVTCDGTLPDGGHGKTAAVNIAGLPGDDWHSSLNVPAEHAFHKAVPQRPVDMMEAQKIANHVSDREGVPRPMVGIRQDGGDASYYAPPKPGRSWSRGEIMLAQNHQHEGVVLHELTHHLLQHRGVTSEDDAGSVHGPEFAKTHARVLAQYHSTPGANIYMNQARARREADMRDEPYDHPDAPENTWTSDALQANKDKPHHQRFPGRSVPLPEREASKAEENFCETQATPVPDNHEPYRHTHDWLPHDHFFAPGKKDLDERLFDGDRMRPEVRRHILGLINGLWAPRYGDSWQTWARVYLAGSEASHFYGNSDLDVLIGIDHEALNQHCDAFCGEPDATVDEKLTDELREHLNDDHRMLPGPGGETGPWESTFYVNAGSYDIRDIKPYAAYDITRDEWAVRPVEVPDDFGPEKLPESTWDTFEAIKTLVKAVAELPAGVREREGAALYDYLHGDRHAAFGPDGTGLYDPANATWKALDKAPGKPLQQLIDWKHAHDGATAPEAAA
ncbi:hypothetical protein ACH4S8_37335 [Streptomyces sp. NPDC021080]|uniref:hypothetical protein n=1 Tax=Streptomyces sp. NPDC021080 TaxID=3365110 RepID=UPI00378EBE44